MLLPGHQKMVYGLGRPGGAALPLLRRAANEKIPLRYDIIFLLKVFQ